MKWKEMNVLVVDDDPAACQLISSALCRSQEPYQFCLETADTLEGAVRRLGEKHFDNVVLDLGLPDSRGIETVETLQRTAPDIAIVVLTAESDTTIECEARRHGADQYLVKGKVPWDSLNLQIQYAIEHHKAAIELRHKINQFHTILEHAPFAMVHLAGDGRITETNVYARTIFGDRFEPGADLAGALPVLCRRDITEAFSHIASGKSSAQTRVIQIPKPVICKIVRVDTNPCQGMQIMLIAQEAMEFDADRFKAGCASRVLVMESDPYGQVLLTSTLESFGLATMAVHSVDSLNPDDVSQFDVAVMEVATTPNRQKKVLQSLRNSGLHIPILGIVQDTHALEIYAECGFDALLVRPWHRKSLYETLANLVRMPEKPTAPSRAAQPRRASPASQQANTSSPIPLAALDALLERISRTSETADPDTLRELARRCHETMQENTDAACQMLLHLIAGKQIDQMRATIQDIRDLCEQVVASRRRKNH